MSERDRELVQAAQRGEATAVGELFARYWRAARAAAFGITGDLASAEDAAAEAFNQALAGVGSLRDPDRFGAWLRTIVVRNARLGLRPTYTAIDAVSDTLSDSGERPDQVLERLELEALVRHAMRAIPEPLREAMALVCFEGYESEAAARFLDVPPGTLRRRLHEGRARLRTTVERILQGRIRMNEARKRETQKLEAMIDNGEFYQAMRGTLALRSPSSELFELLFRCHKTLDEGQPTATSKDGTSKERIAPALMAVLHPSPRTSDLNHPVGWIAAAIVKALPDFEGWKFNAVEVAEDFVRGRVDHREQLRSRLPPSFVEGRPGAFLRLTRGLFRLSGSGPLQTVYESLKDSPDQQIFRAAINDLRLSDVIDLTWRPEGPLELRSVQALLERLAVALLPDTPVRFSGYDEPRYRSALQLHVGEVSARAAHGGVLAECPGHPESMNAAHVRICLEPWASVRSGQVIEFDPLPEPLHIGSD